MILCNIPEGSASVRDIETIFPELLESEDEKIRKSIIATIEQCPDDFLNPKNRDRMLAWLERQKEQKPVQSEEEKEYIRTLKSRIADFLRGKDKDEVDTTYYQRICDWLDGRHVERKPTDEQFPPLEGLDAIKAKYYDDGFKNGFDEGVASVKPAWSKEDEAMLDSIISVVEDWENEQSEEEKEYYGATSKSDWLKSLRPDSYKNCNSRWKPSEEQIEVDLEEEIKRWWGEEYMKNSEGLPILPIVQGIARHFYEFGLNARKEEQ